MEFKFKKIQILSFKNSVMTPTAMMLLDTRKSYAVGKKNMGRIKDSSANHNPTRNYVHLTHNDKTLTWKANSYQKLNNQQR